MEPGETSPMRTAGPKESKCDLRVFIVIDWVWALQPTSQFIFCSSSAGQRGGAAVHQFPSPVGLHSQPGVSAVHCQWQNTTATVEKEWPFQPLVKMWLWEMCLKAAQLWETHSEAHSVITSSSQSTMKIEWIEQYCAVLCLAVDYL